MEFSKRYEKYLDPSFFQHRVRYLSSLSEFTVCVRACVCACVHVCVWVWVCVHVCVSFYLRIEFCTLYSFFLAILLFGCGRLLCTVSFII